MTEDKPKEPVIEGNPLTSGKERNLPIALPQNRKQNRKAGHIENAYRYKYSCPACGIDMVLTFKKPKPGEPVVIRVACIIPKTEHLSDGCGSEFQFKIEKRRMLDVSGVEFPLTITRKVLHLSHEGKDAFRLAHPKKEERPRPKSLADTLEEESGA